MHDIVMDGDMEQIMYMRKTRFRQKYVSMVHNFITKVRNSSKHVYALCLKKNIANNPLNNTQLPFKTSTTDFLELLHAILEIKAQFI